eukprot:gene4116-5867_t
MSIPQSNNQSNTQSPNPVLQFYQQWSEKTPYITRTSTISILFVYLLSFFFSADSSLGNIPYFTVQHFEVYRIILSPLVGNSFFTILMILLMYPTMGSKMEWVMGSSAYLFLIMNITLITNIAFIILCYILIFVGMPEQVFRSCAGFWTIIFALLQIECLQTPDAPRRLLCIPMDIPAKYLPAVLYLFISLFSGFELSYAVSIVVGYLFSAGYLDRFKPSSSYLISLESAEGIFSSISRSRGWVLASGSGHDSWIPTNSQQILEERNQQESVSSQSSSRVSSSSANQQVEPKDTFPGSGHRLAGSGSSNNSMFSGTIAQPPSFMSMNSREAESYTPSRAEINAKRLAALSGRSSNQTV